MLNERTAVVRTITTGLSVLEEQLDAALLTHAQLQADVVQGRRSANLPLDAGQEGIEKLVEATAALFAARKAVHDAHYAFRQDRKRMRLPIVSYGDMGDTPDSIAPRNETSSAPKLALVDAAA